MVPPMRATRSLPLAAGVLVLLSLIGWPEPSPSAGAACPGNPKTLSPKGKHGAGFTMLLRINKPENVAEFASLQAAHGQIRARDLFVVNTRFGGMTIREQSEILAGLRARFPCNRVVALNGLGSDPRRPGYALALTSSPHPWAVMLDWERQDWGRARATNPRLSRWKRRFARSLNRLGAMAGRVARGLHAAGGGTSKLGAVSTYFRDWNYGRIARALDRRNRRLGHRRGSIQAVATQGSCMKYRGRTKGMRGTTRRLMRQYRRAKRKRRNLAVQISFSDHARVKRHLPVRSVNEWRAARCLRAALRAGAGAVLFWASPDSMRALFQNHRFRQVRHRR